MAGGGKVASLKGGFMKVVANYLHQNGLRRKVLKLRRDINFRVMRHVRELNLPSGEAAVL